MADFVGAVDQGTTSTRFMIFDHGGNEVASHQLEHEQILPQAGWVEHNPMEIWERTRAVIETALNSAGLQATRPGRARHHQPARDHRGVEPEHRPAVLQRDRLAGHPHRPHRLRARARRHGRRDPAQGRAAAGDLLLRRQDPVDPGERRRGARRPPRRGDAIFGNTDTWLLWNLTGGIDGGVHVTDPTNASRTMLMNLETLDWDDELLSFFDIPRQMLPGDPAVVRPRPVRHDPRRTARSAARCR